MKIFQDALILGLNLGGVRYISKKESESYAELLQFMKHTKKCFKIVTGELDPALYEKSETILSFENLLEKGLEVKIVFHGDDNIKDLSEYLEIKNPELCHLKRKFKDRLKIFWTPVRPISHYGIVDNRHVFFEEPHEKYQKRDVYFDYNDNKFASRLEKVFDKYVSSPKVKELKFNG